MNQDQNTGGVRCHDADACAMGQLPCPTPKFCGCAEPACVVKDGTHKPAEAVHQIAEPQSEALRLAAWLLHRGMSGIKQNDIEASNQLRWLHAESLQHKQELAAYRFTVANREARIAELEGQLEAIGAGGVERLRASVRE